MIGSPIVFHTAPPQPSSNALATWPYVLVGGPEASQKEFGLSMPAKVVRRSAMGQPVLNLLRRGHAFRGGIHDFGAAVGAIAAGEHARIGGDTELGARALADRHDHHVAGNRFAAAQLEPGDRAVAHDASRRGVEAESTAVFLGELVLIVI